ncbi:hypothetical protein DBR06_SOUSAS9010059, partial [Sousa chinensis]
KPVTGSWEQTASNQLNKGKSITQILFNRTSKVWGHESMIYSHAIGALKNVGHGPSHNQITSLFLSLWDLSFSPVGLKLGTLSTDSFTIIDGYQISRDVENIFSYKEAISARTKINFTTMVAARLPKSTLLPLADVLWGS